MQTHILGYDYSTDLPMIERYNARLRIDDPRRLQIHMTPAPFDGDPFTADVLVLMNNPGYESSSTPEDHMMSVVGWPLVGMSPQARSAFRKWYSRPFGYLIRQLGAQTVANKVAIVQRNPWASQSFDPGLALPSQSRQVEVTRQAVERGAVVVAGRSHAFWRDHFGGAIHYVRNVRNPALSPGGLTAEGWAAVQNRIYRDH